MARAAAPAGLCAPSRSTSRSPAASSSSRPGQVARSYPRAAGGVADPGDARGRERIEDGVGHRDVRGLVPAEQADAGPAEPRQLDGEPVAVHLEDRGRLHHGQRDVHPLRPGAG